MQLRQSIVYVPSWMYNLHYYVKYVCLKYLWFTHIHILSYHIYYLQNWHFITIRHSMRVVESVNTILNQVKTNLFEPPVDWWNIYIYLPANLSSLYTSKLLCEVEYIFKTWLILKCRNALVFEFLFISPLFSQVYCLLTNPLFSQVYCLLLVHYSVNYIV